MEIKFVNYKLPNPYTYEKYNKLNPEILSRWLTIAEKEQQHRHEMNEKIVSNNKTENLKLLKEIDNENTFTDLIRLGFLLLLICLTIGECLKR